MRAGMRSDAKLRTLAWLTVVATMHIPAAGPAPLNSLCPSLRTDNPNCGRRARWREYTAQSARQPCTKRGSAACAVPPAANAAPGSHGNGASDAGEPVVKPPSQGESALAKARIRDAAAELITGSATTVTGRSR